MVWLLLKLCTSVFMSWCPWRRESGIWCYSWKNNHSLLGVLKRAAQIEQEGPWRRKKKYLWSKGFLMCLRGNSYGKGQIREKLWFIGCLADAARNFLKNKFELHIKNEKKKLSKAKWFLSQWYSIFNSSNIIGHLLLSRARRPAVEVTKMKTSWLLPPTELPFYWDRLNYWW